VMIMYVSNILVLAAVCLLQIQENPCRIGVVLSNKIWFLNSTLLSGKTSNPHLTHRVVR
jgi:hypothetical protein